MTRAVVSSTPSDSRRSTSHSVASCKAYSTDFGQQNWGLAPSFIINLDMNHSIQLQDELQGQWWTVHSDQTQSLTNSVLCSATSHNYTVLDHSQVPHRGDVHLSNCHTWHTFSSLPVLQWVLLHRLWDECQISPVSHQQTVSTKCRGR